MAGRTLDVLAVQGGQPPYNMIFSRGFPPAGSVATPEGRLGIFPRAPGHFTFTVSATDQAGVSVQRDFELTVIKSTVNDGSTSASPIRALASLTPGARNPSVTQSTIRSTICSATWVARARPSAAYLRRLKASQMRRYGEAGPVRLYEEDHLIPLELGGAARNPRNLWPEPVTRAHKVDAVEQHLHAQVCSGRLTLRLAQSKIVKLKRSNG
jgi:hypothetical protein